MDERGLEQAGGLVAFWRAAGRERWFTKDAAFDAMFRDRYLDLHFAAARRELDAWGATAEGALARLLLLDQFPRNAFRGTGHMYATDPLARLAADQAVAAGLDQAVELELRVFFYLPFAHSEVLADQDRSLALNERLGGDYPGHAARHRDIVLRFGRFPHRNPILGRTTTAAEAAFLAEGGFAG
ncbi:uncharacterized protein (DUF924 family) [Stella humosa]|uniref:Uncharacterized protein (DUF924 family) n=2 Tax=Stella humosa TaxID=94 RepID=A0A3N1M9Q6_9PROT|nr:uncharacterized protein (DUF924 family) [Stella humosa]